MNDLCFYYVSEAVELANQYEEISLADCFLEDVSEKTNANEKIEKGVIASLKKAIDTVLKMISDVTGKIRDAIRNLFMSKEQKESLENCENEIKENPEVGKQQIEVEDFNKMEKVYDEAMKQADEAEKSEADPSVGEKIMSFLKRNLETIGIVVTVYGGLTLLKKSKSFFDKSQSQLKQEETGLEKLKRILENHLGMMLKNKQRSILPKSFGKDLKLECLSTNVKNILVYLRKMLL